MSSRLTVWILSGMLLGAVVGSFTHSMLDGQLAHVLVSDYLSIATDLSSCAACGPPVLGAFHPVSAS
jgi:hypothetical protein